MVNETRTMSPVTRVLIFSLITDQRDGGAVFQHLANKLVGGGIQHVIFTTYERTQDMSSHTTPSNHTTYAHIWKTRHPTTTTHFTATIQEALGVVAGLEGGEVQVLVTGSQYLVGGVLSLI